MILLISSYTTSTLSIPSLRLPNPLHPSLHSTLPNRGSRNSITSQRRPINTNSNPFILWRIKLSSLDTSRLSSSLARDLEIDTVGIVLSTVVMISGMQSDDFMTEDIRACDDRGRDCDGPGVVVGD
jgi:hypothetical protein